MRDVIVITRRDWLRQFYLMNIRQWNIDFILFYFILHVWTAHNVVVFVVAV